MNMERSKMFFALISVFGLLIPAFGDLQDARKYKMMHDDVEELKQEVRLLSQEENKLRKIVLSQNEYCKIIPETTCGPCMCRDSNKLPSKYYCDCQNLNPERDCRAFYESGAKINGVYKVHQNNLKLIQVYCDQTTDGGGWTVFQRRRDGSVNFYRDWFNYKVGFGDMSNEFWLGNAALSTLSIQALYPNRSELRIDLETWGDIKKYAKYSDFQIGDEHTKYKLHATGYSGNAGDSISKHHSGLAFSTYNKDNDGSPGNCAEIFKGGWWYGNCYHANLNGRYYFYKEKIPNHSGIHWNSIQWNSIPAPIKLVEMKIRRK